MRNTIIISLCCLSLGSDCSDRRLDAIDEGAYAAPEYLPWDIVLEGGLDEQLLLDAISWWQSQLPGDCIAYHYEPDLEADYPPATHGVLRISTGYVDEPALGRMDYALRDGEVILYGEIVISSDIVDENLAYWVLIHELGHALGLADDARSIDYPSVMASPIIEGGELLPGDLELALDLCGAA